MSGCICSYPLLNAAGHDSCLDAGDDDAQTDDDGDGGFRGGGGGSDDDSDADM